MNQTNSAKNSGCWLGCSLLVLALLAVLVHCLYTFPVAGVLGVGRWVPVGDGELFEFDAEFRPLAYLLTILELGLPALGLGYAWHQAFHPDRIHPKWRTTPKSAQFSDLDSLFEAESPKEFLLEYYTRREKQKARYLPQLIWGPLWICVSLNLVHLLLMWHISPNSLVGPPLSLARLGLLALCLIPGLLKMLVGYNAMLNMLKTDERLLVRPQDGKVYLVDVLRDEPPEIYVPFSRLSKLELRKSRFANMTVADSFALELVGQEQLTISLGSGAHSQLERARAICARLAEIFGCPWEESETVLPPQH